MASILHIFKSDLKNRPAPGVSAPPVGIRAKDLDDNFTKVQVIESGETDPKPYEVEYTKEGTRLRNIKTSRDGVNDGDLLYWKAEERRWIVFPAVRSNILHVLGLKDGRLGWIATEACE
jgi:hypothetical protein